MITGNRIIFPLFLVCIYIFTEQANALTREEVITTVELYRDLTYDVGTLNIFPGNESGCYNETCRNTVPIGSNQGVAYSWGNWYTPDAFIMALDADCGAGNGSCMGWDCYSLYMCGIDCSGLVAKAWGLSPNTKPGTGDLFSFADEIPMADLKKGDVLDLSGTHVVIFSNWEEPYPEARVIESNLPPGYVHQRVENVETRYVNCGYVPLICKALVDSPATTLLSLGSDSTGAIEWETGWERNTDKFVVYKNAGPGEPTSIVGWVSGVGSINHGARYSLRDAEYTGPGTVYRLQEIETSGQTISLGRTSAADGLPPQQNEQTTAAAIWSERPSPRKVCSITQYSENWNFDWLAICPDEWLDELQPLVQHRQSKGYSAGTWTFQELESCTMFKPTRGDIRGLLQWAYNEWTTKPKYLLLVGDAYYQGGDSDLIPMWASYEPELAWADEDSTWSDRPYADLDDDGEAEIYVGRIPAVSATDVTNAVAKIIERDNSTDPTYGKRSLLFVEDSGDCGNDATWIRNLANEVNDCIPAEWSRDLIAQSDIGGTYADWEAVADSAWDAGQGLVLFFGNCSGWWDFNNFMNVGGGWHCGKLTANHKYPFVFGGSCGEGGLDRENYYDRAVMEQLLCSYADRGAVGGLLPSRSLHSHTAMQLACNLMDRIDSGEPTLGSATYHAMGILLAENPGAADHVWEYVFFGDPAMRVRALQQGTDVTENTNRETFAFALKTPLPHPISTLGAIRYSIPTAAKVDVKIYDVAGRLVRVLVSGRQERGGHTAEWDGKNEQGRGVSSGIYFVRLRSGSRETSKKVTLLR